MDVHPTKNGMKIGIDTYPIESSYCSVLEPGDADLAMKEPESSSQIVESSRVSFENRH